MSTIFPVTGLHGSVFKMDRIFIKGMKLAEGFYQEVIGPILKSHFPGLEYSAGRINHGSDVLGYDTPLSMDHGWGPMMEIYLSPDDYQHYAPAIDRAMGENLPSEFMGFPTNYDVDNDWVTARKDSGPICHGVKCYDAEWFVTGYRVFDPAKEITTLDWLTVPQQDLRMIRSGKVLFDGLGTLKTVQDKLHYYPADVWLYILQAQWDRVADEEAFVGRCGDAGDELGSRVIAARLVRILMGLCFLMEKQYMPYSKWFGTAFSELGCSEKLLPVFRMVLDSLTWRDREKHLCEAYEFIASMHNGLGITEQLPGNVRPFHKRPYLIIHAGDFASAIYKEINDESVKRLPKRVGSIDQITDATGIVDYQSARAKLVAIYNCIPGDI